MEKQNYRRSSFSGQTIADRSLSEGARRRPRKPNVSRDSSTGSSVASLDVRCACQYYKSDALLPDRVKSRPTSYPVGNVANHAEKSAPITKTVHFRLVVVSVAKSNIFNGGRIIFILQKYVLFRKLY